jgi:DNA-binding NarL/FixJ family response regulator
VEPDVVHNADRALRIVMAEDDPLLREGLALLLRAEGLDVAATAGTADDALAAIDTHRPDIAILDVRMPPTHTDEGIKAALVIRRQFPDVALLVLSQYVEESYATDLLSEATSSVGYLLKDRVADVDTFTDAVRRVAGGGSALDPEVVALLLGRRRREDPLQSITPREREVLELIARGLSNREIATELVIEESTVKTHVKRVLTKLDARDRVHAVIFAYETGVAAPGSGD